jgi:CRISPR system Cascade subunit CasE
MLYLSRFARPDGDVSLHRYVMSGYPKDLGPDPRKQAGVLFRVDGGSILVQSTMKPKWPKSYEAQVKLEFKADLLNVGERYRFRFGLNSVAQSNRDGRCRRYPVPPSQWLAAREEMLGATFDIRKVESMVFHDHVKREHYTRSFPIHVSVIDGYLTVTHADRLAQAMVNGIGREKPYGCGLLSLLPVVAVTPAPSPVLVGVVQA